MTKARMDGTTEQQLMWRINALREALHQAKTIEDTVAGAIFAKGTCENALNVDNGNASLMTEGS